MRGTVRRRGPGRQWVAGRISTPGRPFHAAPPPTDSAVDESGRSPLPATRGLTHHGFYGRERGTMHEGDDSGRDARASLPTIRLTNPHEVTPRGRTTMLFLHRNPQTHKHSPPPPPLVRSLGVHRWVTETGHGGGGRWGGGASCSCWLAPREFPSSRLGFPPSRTRRHGSKARILLGM